MSAVFDELVKLSGLSPIFAKTVVRRAVERAGVDAEMMVSRDIERILPELERALAVYLGEGVAANRTAELKRALAA